MGVFKYYLADFFRNRGEAGYPKIHRLHPAKKCTKGLGVPLQSATFFIKNTIFLALFSLFIVLSLIFNCFWSLGTPSWSKNTIFSPCPFFQDHSGGLSVPLDF